jgi:Na+/H+ antiporter NhaD and related arsenite permeases
MQFFEFSQTGEAVLTLTVVVVMFILFVREIYPTEVVAIAGAALMLALGLLPYDSALAVLSNPAPWTIGAMFIVMGALVRTGALNAFTSLADAKARTNPKLAIAALMGFVVVASAVGVEHSCRGGDDPSLHAICRGLWAYLARTC